MVLRCPRDDRSSRQLITFSPGRRPRLGHTPRVSTRKRANNVERGAWNPRNGAGGVRFRRVHDGVPMTAANPTVSVTESVRSTVELDARASRAADGELSARFQSDVIPLLEPLHHHAMRMTRNQRRCRRPSENDGQGLTSAGTDSHRSRAKKTTKDP